MGTLSFWCGHAVAKAGFFLACLLTLFGGLGSAWAQTRGTEMYVCVGKDGVRTYQNSSGGDGCSPLNLNPITIVPTVKPATPSSLGGPSKNARQDIGDLRSADEFEARNDRMKILQEELGIEEAKLKSLQDEYKGGQPDRLGNEKNYQKFLDRTARLEREIKQTSENMAILKTELNKLAQ